MSQLQFNFAQWELQAGCNCYINAMKIKFIIIIIIIVNLRLGRFSQITHVLKQSDWYPIRTTQVPQFRFSHITDYSYNHSFAILWNGPHFEWREYLKKTASKHQDEMRRLCVIKCPTHKLQNSKSNYPWRHGCEQTNKRQQHHLHLKTS